MRSTKAILLAMMFLSCFLSSPKGTALAADYIYYSDNGTDRIVRADPDGTNIVPIVTGIDFPRGIAVDQTGGKIYWTETVRNEIQRCNLDGSDIESLLTVPDPTDIALDVVHGKMYWTGRTGGTIESANLNGTAHQVVITGLNTPIGIAVDGYNNQLYWVDAGMDKIKRAKLDGSSIEDLVTGGMVTPEDVELDLGSGKMYWSDAVPDKIMRANLDGTNVVSAISGVNSIRGIALDPWGGKLYWSDVTTHTIHRADLDGSGDEIIIDAGGGSFIYDIDFVPEPATMSLLAIGGIALLKRSRRK